MIFRNIRLSLANAALLVPIVTSWAHGASIVESQKVVPGDLVAEDYFGWSAAMSGDHAVVGAFANATDQHGSATFYRLSGATWVQSARLPTPSGYRQDGFGMSVAISGEWAVVGAPRDRTIGTTAGAAHVFQWSGSGWVLRQTLFGSDTAASDRFGDDVGIAGNRIIVGAPSANSSVGAAYVFERSTGDNWSQIGKLTPNDGIPSGYFGRAVDISGDSAVVGASRNSAHASGAAYAFERNAQGWQPPQALTTSSTWYADELGTDVAIDGDLLVVGAQSHIDPSHGGVGGAFVFRRAGSAWHEETELVPPPPPGVAYYENFGRAVDISGTRVVVGAYNSRSPDNVTVRFGSAHTFEFDGVSWRSLVDLIASDRADGDAFGISAAISGSRALIGAIGDDDRGNNSGAGYFYVVPEPASSLPSTIVALWISRRRRGQ